MKKIPYLMLVLAGCLAFISCTNDSNDNNTSPLSESLTGTYQLTSAILPTTQDLDRDGDNSTNAVLEGPCYNDSWISFHSDGTYDLSMHSSTATAAGLNLDCSSQDTSGTYVLTGNSLTTIETGSGDTAVYTFNASGRTIALTDTSAAFPSWNSITSLWTNLNGALQFTYTKYTDNDEDYGDTADTDGVNDDENNANFWLLGDFSLTSFVIPSAQNLDHDTDNNTNLVLESSCYGQSYVTFNENGTYEEERTFPTIADNMLFLSCDSETTAGTWTRTGNTITTTRIGLGTGSATTTYNFNATTHLLTRTDATGNFPIFSTATSLFAMLNGAVNYTYTRS